MLEKVIARAHPVSGLIVFHGYRNPELKTMPIDIIYLCMDSLITQTELEISGDSTTITINDNEPDAKTSKRIKDYVRHFTEDNFRFRSSNNFEMAVGLASSASGYAALAGAVNKALGLEYGNLELSRIARRGSISAASSIAGGLSVIRASQDYNYDPPAERIMSPTDLGDLTIVIGCCNIKKDSQDSHSDAITSPFYPIVVQYAQNAARDALQALCDRDIEKLSAIVENHNLMNYTVLHSGRSQTIVWRPETISMIRGIREIRKAGEPIFFSMNTGANVFAYCFSESATEKVKSYFQSQGIDYKVTKIGDGLQ